MKQYALYLRKSRADLDAEARGEGETLAKHRVALTEYARRRGLLIVREYAEIVSGDSIAARPQMQALLEDVKAGAYAGVIVNDVDRLGRGDGIDQEIIKYAFAASNTRIITPAKDIDFSNTTDEDLFDFKAFFARTEYKMISRRMAQGRTRSAAAGNWVSGNPPYGYRVTRQNGAIRLTPDPETAPIVKMIYEWYANGEAGYHLIAQRLAEMGIKSPKTGKPFSPHVIHRMLSNPAYTGRTEYGQHATVSAIEDGRRIKKYVPAKPGIVIADTHPAIISPEVWQAVRSRSALAQHRSPVNTNKYLTNPLAGLIVCAQCGAMMQMGRSAKRMITCKTPGCTTSAICMDTLESIILDVLRSWCATYAAPMARPEPVEKYEQREALQRQLDGIAAQLSKAQDLVEMGVYSPSEYLTRRDTLKSRQEAVSAEIEKLTRKSPDEARAAILPAVERVLDAYPLAQTIEQKNALLRSVIDHAVYHKTQRAWRGQNPAKYLQLDVFPIISDSIG